MKRGILEWDLNCPFACSVEVTKVSTPSLGTIAVLTLAYFLSKHYQRAFLMIGFYVYFPKYLLIRNAQKGPESSAKLEVVLIQLFPSLIYFQWDIVDAFLLFRSIVVGVYYIVMKPKSCI